jgi:hypothetical protein
VRVGLSVAKPIAMTPKKTRTRSTRPAAKKKTARKPARARWSKRVTDTSDAMTVEPGIFKSDYPAQVATSLKKSAETSHRRKSSPYRSAMSLLTFYLNRGGRNVAASAKEVLERAKVELQRLFGREASSSNGRARSHKATHAKRTVPHAATS